MDLLVLAGPSPRFDMILTRRFAAPKARMWRAWTDADEVMRWWGPDGFTSPTCRMDFREGGTTLVSMRSEQGFEIYNTWTYRSIAPMERIEFINAFADEHGNRVVPAEIGLPSAIPEEGQRRSWQDEEDARLAKGRRPRKPPAISLPRLTVAEKATVRQSARRYTAMDYLYRLRVKSNYEDSTMFTDGPQDETESSAVHNDLGRLAASVMLLHELHIRRLVGRARMTALVDAWLSKNMPNIGIGLALRRDLIANP